MFTLGKQENEGKAGFNSEWYTDTEKAHIEEIDDTETDNDKEKTEEEKKNEDFWNKPCKYTPESRIEMHKHMEEQRKEKDDYKVPP